VGALVTLACRSPIAAYTDGLATGDCAGIRDAALAEDCRVQAADCDGLSGASGEECWFRWAERSGDGGACARAGAFADDCRMHLFTTRARGLKLAIGEEEDRVAEAVATSGFAADDIRPWSAWYRTALDRLRPLDRGACASVADPAHREACEKTGLALYADRLNRARDQRTWPCHGEERPAVLRHAPDPELDALVAARTDLCP
jgi:hypothetical protein